MSVNFRIQDSSLRQRFSPNVGSGNQVQVKPVQGNGNDLSHNKSVDELQAELKDNKFARWRQYCIGLLAVFEVRPLDDTHDRLFRLAPKAATHAALSKGYAIRCTRTSSQDLPMGALNTNYLIQSISEVMT
jgi:hypothetical protein